MATSVAAEAKPAQNQTSRAGFKRSVTLNTPSAQRALKKYFEVMNANLYNITVSLPIMVDNVELVDELLQAVSDSIEGLEESMNKEVERLTVMHKEYAVKQDLEYTNPQTFDVLCTSPEASRMLDALVHMDKICQMLDALWMAQVLTLRQKLDVDRRWSEAMRKQSNRFRHNAERARKGLKMMDQAKAEEDAPTDIDGDTPQVSSRKSEEGSEASSETGANISSASEQTPQIAAKAQAAG
ncbi:hypothetical protein [Marinobacter goseongensis]|uniref:hypothetical protein n=1 Tax=Marinobacter goseongensis TaxID=453838 RepID=UPI0020043921|nr:hypothetical protein [Marinobacter goseongensis]MCK7553318.1 hypothetical protein [Marinobacter goseongensis]